MDAATVKEVERLAHAADPKRRIVAAPGEPAGVYYVVGPNGEMARQTAMRPAAAERADDLATLAAVAQRWKEEGADAFVAVWYDRNGVLAVGNWHDSPPDHCAVPLAPSPQLSLLQQWRKAERVTVPQRDLVLLLRTLFAGCWSATPTLLDAVRRLRTSKAAEVNAEVQRGKVSLGRSMTAEMSGVGDIPEMVTFEVPVFAGSAVRVTAPVRVVLDPDPETEQFTAVVLPDEIDRTFAVGEDRAQAMLDSLLTDTGIPVYHGRP